MGGKSAPAPPDYTPFTEAAIESAKLARQTAVDQLEFSKQRWAEQQDLLRQVLDTQLPIMRQQFENAQKDRTRYETKFQPLEDNLIKEFQSYASPERANLEAGRAQAGVTDAFQAQRANAARRLESFGVDPSQTRAAALDLGMRATQAATQAAQGNAARTRVENTGRALRAESINIGRGLPSQVAGSYGQAIGAGTNAVGNYNQSFNANTNSRGIAANFMNAGTGAINAGASALNMGYNNALGAAKYEADNGLGAALTTLGGAALGGWSTTWGG